ncbi:hypothetical protein ACF0H5_000436 [Mactra antiquata]
MEMFCLNCAKKFNRKEDLEEHVCVENSENIKKCSENQCEKCNKKFYSKYTRKDHEKLCVKNKICKKDITTCKKCGKKFILYTNRKRHEKKCENSHVSVTPSESHSIQSYFICAECGEKFINCRRLIEHQNATNHVRPGGSRDFQSNENKSQTKAKTCRPGGSRDLQSNEKKTQTKARTCQTCKETFESCSDLYTHRSFVHHQSEEKIKHFQPTPWNDELPPWEREDGTINDELKLTYEKHKHLILMQRQTTLTNEIRFNFPTTNNISPDNLIRQIEEIYDTLDHAFKVNISFGTTLVNIETNRYRYFAPFFNNSVFDLPLTISDRQGIEHFADEIRRLDILGYVMQQRPDTKFKPIMITNVLFTVYQTAFPLGCGRKLPRFILKNKYIIPFDKNPNTKKLYDDDLCMFRCIAYHQSRSVFIEKLAKELHSRWLLYCETEKSFE